MHTPTTWIAAWLHLLAAETTTRAKRLWMERDRGSFATDFAITTGAIILIALLVVGIYKTFAEGKANEIGNAP